MCLILFSYGEHPDYPLIMAANRDEFYERATAPADFWEESPQLLAGRDLVRGGTWLGVTRAGRVAMVTNYRDRAELKRSGRSRGKLVSGFLLGGEAPQAYLDRVAGEGGAYNGFNLLAGDAEGLWYFSNRQGTPRRLRPGLYGLSNHLLDTPWPKVAGGKAALTEALENRDGPDAEALFSLLRDTERAPDELLPDTGFGPEWERILSSRFIAGPEYGTRSSTVLLIGSTGSVTFVERTYDRSPERWTEVRRSFSTVA